jgi:hypothetical protein
LSAVGYPNASSLALACQYGVQGTAGGVGESSGVERLTILPEFRQARHRQKTFARAPGSGVLRTSVRIRVLIDGQVPGAAHGIDVDEQGNGTVTDQRLYQLVRQPKPIADRLFEIEFLDSGVEAFAFTFG